MIIKLQQVLKIVESTYLEQLLRTINRPTLSDFDLDSYNISVRPTRLPIYCGADGLVHLISHAPTLIDVDEFKNWVFVGKSSCHIRISPEFKRPVLDELIKSGFVLGMSSFETAFINGAQAITVTQLMRALVNAQVPEVRLNAFGMKASLCDLHHDLGAEDGPLSRWNWFDIGVYYPHEDIVLIRPAPGYSVFNTYPMFLELGRGYGSVTIKSKTLPTIDKVKIYPRIVHALKSTSTKHITSLPNNARSWHNALDSVVNKVQKLDDIYNDNVENYGGFRIECSITVSCLSRACRIAERTPYFHARHYVQP
ncbi:hypothetical protein PGTUg99_003433 [Puccinia graminis f. sp. tritici]|uniref:Uncharacterized protein n=1 Tax=Puccinia graminis f. sp. tritici TaxID=56615 RepID=A0A5B0RAG6_PUCGR|nr:hypothetical protein PGTUg99_003433 [Puccinia graminis f. sp. tritici]